MAGGSEGKSGGKRSRLSSWWGKLGLGAAVVAALVGVVVTDAYHWVAREMFGSHAVTPPTASPAPTPTPAPTVTPSPPTPSPDPSAIVAAGSCTQSGFDTAATWTCDLFKDEGVLFKAGGDLQFLPDATVAGGNVIFQPQFNKLIYEHHAPISHATVNACRSAQGSVSDEASITLNLYDGVMACSIEAGGLVAFVQILDVSHATSATQPDLKLKVWFKQI